MLDIPAIGESYSASDCEANCCDETSITIDFEDDVDPEFDNPPTDIILMCFDEVPPMLDLDVTDNCTPDAVVAGMEIDNSNMCDGGLIFREWAFTDDCGNQVLHSQTINVEAIPEPEYTGPPADV